MVHGISTGEDVLTLEVEDIQPSIAGKARPSVSRCQWFVEEKGGDYEFRG